ncbi:MAG: stage V sporulation protein AD [Lachnospiraceae bacterium]|nr:stage V sporulation protein AD [Lachnospiraceae bacterium]
MNQQVGKASIRFGEPVYIINSASIVGTKEGQGPLKDLFDMVGEDDMFGAKTWEEAESSLQKDAVYLALNKANLKPNDVRYLFAGDLLGQSIATSFGVSSFEIPMFGVYGACSTCGESLSLGAMTIAGGYADRVVCVTSSHFASAEKEFRFPLEYGNQRPLSASWTVTGSGAFVVDKDPGNTPRACITGITTGKIMDYGLKDSMNMGACMAPAAADTIEQHFKDFQCGPDVFDKIITGDLGSVGQTVLLDLMREKGYDIASIHMDCGVEIYDAKTQDTHAGGSGCGCSAVTLSAYILKQLEEKKWKKVLFLPTGALLSKTSFNEGQSVPGIAHGLVLESIK